MMAPVRLAEVAAEAGLGESTVSRVLRNDGSFSPKAREKVLKAAAKLGYVPNRLASSLASDGSRLVAIVVPSLTNIVFADVLKGAGDHLDAAGYRGVFGVTDYSPPKEEQLVESLLEYRPAAVLLAGLDHTARTRDMLAGARCRVVELLDTDGEGIDHVVGFSNRAAGAAAADHLAGCGYRDIGYVGHDLRADRRAGRRLAAFEDGLARHGLALRDRETTAPASSAAAGRAGLALLLERAPRLDAVYCSNDDIAIGCFLHCLAAGIDVPGRLAIFGHNGLDIGQVLPRPLSTVRPPRAKIGRRAAELALSGAPATTLDLGFELLAGGTTRWEPAR